RHLRCDQLLGKFVDAVARADIDHPGPLWPLGHELENTVMALRLLALGRQSKFWSRKAVDEFTGVLEAQLGADIIARPGIRSGGDGETRRTGKDVGEAAEHAVFRAKVVAPLADAMCFVD